MPNYSLALQSKSQKNHEWTPQEAWERGDLVENLILSLVPLLLISSLYMQPHWHLKVSTILRSLLPTICLMFYKLKSMQGQVEEKKNVNWVVSFSPKASTYNFAKAKVELKNWV